jgi:hypothetical protein
VLRENRALALDFSPQTSYSCKSLHTKFLRVGSAAFFAMARLHGIARKVYGEKMMAKECHN